MKNQDEQVDEIFEQDKLMASVLLEPCKRHNPFQGGYMVHMAFMEEKVSHGAKQRRCNTCGYYFFKNEF